MERRMMDIDRNVETKVDHLIHPVDQNVDKNDDSTLDIRKNVKAARRQNFISRRNRESEDRQKRLLFLFQSAKSFVTYKNMSEKIDEALMSTSVSDPNVYKRQIDFETQDLNKNVYNGKRTYVLKDILGGRYLNFDDLDTVREKVSHHDEGIEQKINEFKLKLSLASETVKTDGIDKAKDLESDSINPQK
jgi:hypothetical protein